MVVRTTDAPMAGATQRNSEARLKLAPRKKLDPTWRPINHFPDRGRDRQRINIVNSHRLLRHIDIV